jgi:hypothetical protein
VVSAWPEPPSAMPAGATAGAITERNGTGVRIHHKSNASSRFDFTEGHELPDKWQVAKEMVGRRLSQTEAKRLLAELE